MNDSMSPKELVATWLAAGPSSTEGQAMVAEGDVVVMELDGARTTHDGDSYRNAYCITVQVRDGKIVKVREHADTLYNEQVCMGTPEKQAAVLDRLARLRAAAEH